MTRYAAKAVIAGLFLATALHGGVPEEEVLILTKPGAIVMPQGKTVVTLEEIEAMSEVKDILQAIQTQEIRKAMPEFDPADTMRTAPDGNIARLPNFSNLFILSLPPGADRDSAVVLLESLPQVIYAEKNERVKLRVEPNDPYFEEGRQWNLKNEGQYGGTSDADIDAPEAWDITTGSNDIIVGIIDRGIDENHKECGATRKFLPKLFWWLSY